MEQLREVANLAGLAQAILKDCKVREPVKKVENSTLRGGFPNGFPNGSPVLGWSR